jgi:hypothetical protein
MQNQLAAIDFNQHRGRLIAKTVEGKERYISHYNASISKENLLKCILLKRIM